MRDGNLVMICCGAGICTPVIRIAFFFSSACTLCNYLPCLPPSQSQLGEERMRDIYQKTGAPIHAAYALAQLRVWHRKQQQTEAVIYCSSTPMANNCQCLSLAVDRLRVSANLLFGSELDWTTQLSYLSIRIDRIGPVTTRVPSGVARFGRLHGGWNPRRSFGGSFATRHSRKIVRQPQRRPRRRTIIRTGNGGPHCGVRDSFWGWAMEPVPTLEASARRPAALRARWARRLPHASACHCPSVARMRVVVVVVGMTHHHCSLWNPVSFATVSIGLTYWSGEHLRMEAVLWNGLRRC